MPNKKIQSLTVQGVTYDIVDNTSGYTSNTGTITEVKTIAGAHTTIDVTSGKAEFKVPTKTSDLTNDSGFLTSYTETDPIFVASVAHGITSTDITNWNNKLDSYTETDPTVPAWAKATNKPSYTFSEIGSKPTTISGYGITDAYTKTQVDGLVAGVLHYKGAKASVADLPTTGNVIGDVWHITADGSEYAWDGSVWQELGTAIDLSGYATKATTLAGYEISDAKIENGTITLGSNSITPLISFTETDPIFTASPAYGITATDITNWNSKTSNTGTVTQVSTGTGLSGGPITTSGTITLSTAKTSKISSGLGGVQVWKNWESNTTITAPSSIGSFSGTVTVQNESTVSDRYYAVEATYDGHLIVNVPWTNVNSSYLTSETDPIFTASPAYGITAQDISKWNTAEPNVNADWNATSGDAQILNKPTNVSEFINDMGYVDIFGVDEMEKNARILYVNGGTAILMDGSQPMTFANFVSREMHGLETLFIQVLNGATDMSQMNARPFAITNVDMTTATVRMSTADAGQLYWVALSDVGNGLVGTFDSQTIPTGGITTETDPVFSASAAAGITSTDISNWNNGQIFIATYGVTSYTDLLSEYNNGKIIFCKKNELCVPLTHYKADTFYFKFVENLSEVKQMYVSTSNVWNFGSFTLVTTNRTINGKNLGNNITLTASDVGALPDSTTIPTKTSDLTNDSGFITSYTETDPTVPAWAKAATKPTYTASEVGALPDTTTIPAATTAVNDSGYLYNGQTVDAKLAGSGFSNSTNLLTSTSDTYVALRANSSNPFLGLKCGTNLWYAQAQGNYFYFGPTSAKAMRLDTDGNALFVGTVQANSDLTLYTPSGNSPGIVFQRGTLTDNYNDWKIYDKGGYLYFAQRGSGSTDFGDVGYIDTGGNINNLKIPWGNVTSKPTFATVATSGSYNDLSDKPTIPEGLPSVTTADNGKVLRVVNGEWTAVSLPSASGVSF